MIKNMQRAPPTKFSRPSNFIYFHLEPFNFSISLRGAGEFKLCEWEVHAAHLNKFNGRDLQWNVCITYQLLEGAQEEKIGLQKSFLTSHTAGLFAYSLSAASVLDNQVQFFFLSGLFFDLPFDLNHLFN
jgi:hypothetical protein